MEWKRNDDGSGHHLIIGGPPQHSSNLNPIPDRILGQKKRNKVKITRTISIQLTAIREVIISAFRSGHFKYNIFPLRK